MRFAVAPAICTLVLSTACSSAPAAPKAAAPPITAPTTVATAAGPTIPSSAKPDRAALLAALDAVWGKDWPEACKVAKEFRAAFPSDREANDKARAACIGAGDAAVAAGNKDAAASFYLDASGGRYDAVTDGKLKVLTPAVLLPAGVAVTATAAPKPAATGTAAPKPAAPTATPTPAKNASRGVRPTGGACPASHPIKGNQGSRSTNDWIYHTPQSRSYDATDPEECFASAGDAEAAGYRAPRN